MNWIIISEEELNSERMVSIRDQRHQHIKAILKKNTGDFVQVVIPNVGNFSFLIQEIGETQTILVEAEKRSNVLNPLSVHCFFSLPRPQTTKKILHLAGAYGIESIFFFATETKNKEYWTSPIYKTEWKEWMQTGMSQTGNFREPVVNMAQTENWKHHLEHWPGKVIILDRMGKSDIQNSIQENEVGSKPLYVFGSESGWKPSDLEFFSKQNFLVRTLGNINLRTEFAFSSLLYLLFKN